MIAMKRRIIALWVILALIAGALGAPAALAESRYTASTPLEDASRNNIKNIERAAAAINGVKVESGGRFSFNEIVGPRTKANGYVPAENARGVSVTGGGVAQVDTTLYLALLRLGSQVKFTHLSTYGSRFEDHYVSDGNKAVITDYSGGTDFEFVNQAGDMKIEMWASSTALNCVVTVDQESAANWFGDWGSAAVSTVNPTATPAPAIQAVSASISWTGDKGTLKNIRQAAKSIDGTRLATGDIFSFNDVVGARTRKRGYTSGTNGRGVKVTGGGVAQVASVLWLAVKQMKDISIVEKSTYGKRYNQDYVSSSSDAIVTDYKEKKDFSFRYKGNGVITIHTAVDGNYLNCYITRE